MSSVMPQEEAKKHQKHRFHASGSLINRSMTAPDGLRGLFNTYNKKRSQLLHWQQLPHGSVCQCCSQTVAHIKDNKVCANPEETFQSLPHILLIKKALLLVGNWLCLLLVTIKPSQGAKLKMNQADKHSIKCLSVFTVFIRMTPKKAKWFSLMKIKDIKASSFILKSFSPCEAERVYF